MKVNMYRNYQGSREATTN